jgi:hypothetical protein
MRSHCSGCDALSYISRDSKIQSSPSLGGFIYIHYSPLIAGGKPSLRMHQEERMSICYVLCLKIYLCGASSGVSLTFRLRGFRMARLGRCTKAQEVSP